MGGVDVPDPAADLRQPDQFERGQPQLRGAGVVEPGVGCEVGVQVLGERLQPGRPLRAVEERWGPVTTRFSPGNRPASISSANCRSVLRPLSQM